MLMRVECWSSILPLSAYRCNQNRNLCLEYIIHITIHLFSDNDFCLMLGNNVRPLSSLTQLSYQEQSAPIHPSPLPISLSLSLSLVCCWPSCQHQDPNRIYYHSATVPLRSPAFYARQMLGWTIHCHPFHMTINEDSPHSLSPAWN